MLKFWIVGVAFLFPPPPTPSAWNVLKSVESLFTRFPFQCPYPGSSLLAADKFLYLTPCQIPQPIW